MAKWIFNKKAKTAVSLVLLGVILLSFYFLVFGTAKAEPTAISGCANISTSGLYNLTNNIIDWNGEVGEICININVSDVEFDCQGFTIDGQNTAGTIGIRVYNDSGKLKNVSITNCNLSDWGENGIYYSYSENSTITNITVYNSSSENIYIYLSSNNNFTNITSSNSQQSSGILVWSDSNYNNFANIKTDNNYYDGISFEQTSYNALSNSTAYGNLGDGIILTGSNYTNVRDVVVSSNTESGAEMVDESYNNNFTNITAFNNTENGIGLLANSDYNIITNITASNNSVGIGLFFVTRNQIINSTIQNNTQYGLLLGNSSYNNATRNAISNNTVGIYVQTSSAIETENTSVNRVWDNIINNSQNGRNWNTSGVNYTNYFNTTKIAGVNILGRGNFIAGNYWSDYGGTDADGDKIGDTSYVINASLMSDAAPLVLASVNTAPTITNVNITPSTAYTDSILNCSANYESDVGKGNVTISWYNGSAGTNLFSSKTIFNVNSGGLVSNTLVNIIVQDAENESFCSDNPNQHPWTEGHPCINTIDEDWGTYGNPGDYPMAYVWENFSIPEGAINASFNARVRIGANWGLNFSIWNYTSSSWDILKGYPDGGSESGVQNGTFAIPSTSFNSKIQIRTNLHAGGGGESAYYEGEIIYSVSGIQARGENWNCSVSATDATGIVGNPTSTTKTISNSPPTTSQAGGVENNSRTTNNLVTIKGENSTDADGDTINYVFWNWSGSVPVPLQNSTLTSYDWATIDGNASCWYVTAEDSMGGVSAGTGENCFVKNAKPVVTNVAISPATAFKNSILNCSANFSDVQESAFPINQEMEYDKLNVTFSWYNGSELYSSITILNISQDNTNSSYSLPAGIQAKGEKWNCSVNAFDGYENGTSVNATVTISNSILSMGAVTIAPSPANTTDTLNCSAIGYDIDLDSLTMNFTWYNGSTYHNSSTKTTSNGTLASVLLQAGVQAKGENWNCTVFVNEGIANSPLNSTTKTISNSAPTTPQVGGPANNSRTTTNLVTIRGENSTDADGDTINYVFWVYEGANAVAKQNSTVTSYNITTVDGNAYYWYVTAEDSMGGVSSATGENGFIENAKPVVTNVTITPATAYTNSTLNCSANFSDVQGYDGSEDPELEYDNLSVILSWYNGNELYSSITILNILQNNTNSSFSLPLGIQAKGEKWNCSVNAFDGYENSTSLNATITISNIAPSTGAVTIAPSPANTTDTLNCSATGYDIDLDSLTMNFTWYNGSTYYNSSTKTTSNGTLDSVLLQVGVQAKGENWNCTVFVNDGTLNSQLNSTIRIISNSIPSIPEIGGPENTGRTIGNSQTLRCANSTDEDGDTIRYVFYGGTSANPTTVLQNNTPITYVWATTDGLTYYWRCKAEDWAGGVSGFTPQKTFTENTAPPKVIVASPVNNSRTTGNSANIQWNPSTDAEGDTVTYELLADTSNPPTTSRQNTTGTSYTLSTTEGSTYYTRIKVQDGYETVMGVISNFTENTPPTLPEAGGFINNSRRTGNSVTLRCENSTDAQGDTIIYAKYFDTNANPTTLVDNTTSTTSAQATTDGLTYYFKCKSQDGYETSAFTGIINFTENTAPTISSITLNPSSNVYKTTIGVNATASLTDAEGDAVTYSYLWYSNNASTGITIQNISSSSFSKNNVLTAQIRVYDGYEYSSYKNSSNLTVLNLIPSKVTLSSPASNTTLTNSTPDLKWLNASDEDGETLTYHIQLSNSSDFLTISQNITSNDNFTNISTLADGTYYWRVRAHDSESYSAWDNMKFSFYVIVPQENQTVATEQNITVGNNTKEIVVPIGSPIQNVEINSSIPSDTQISLNLSLLKVVDTNSANVTLSNNLTLTRMTNTYNYSVEVSNGTIISGNLSWNGIINLPTIKPSSSVTVTAGTGNTSSIVTVIEIGYGNFNLTFDRAVRVFIEGQANKYIGYTKDNIFHEITTICAGDNQTAGNSLPEEGDCKINVGNDLVIWTKHFTNFATYTQSAVPPAPAASSGGGGGCTTTWNCTEWSECINGNQTRICTKLKSYCNADKKPDETRVCSIQNVTQTPTPSANITAPMNATNITTQITPPVTLRFTFSGITGAAIRTAKNILGEDIYQFGRSGYYAVKNNKRIVFAILIIAVVLLFIISMLASPKGYYGRAARFHQRAEIYYNKGNFAKANALFNKAEEYRVQGERL